MSSIDQMDEYERSELVRSWIRENGGSVVVGVIAGLALVLGYSQWQQHTRERLQSAEVQFNAYVKAVDAKDNDGAEKILAEVNTKFGDSAYAQFAAMKEAQRKAEAGDTDGAIKALEAMKAGAKLPALADVANVRLAELKLAKGDFDGALANAQAVTTSGYKSQGAELRGDALVGLKRPADAFKAYEDALAAMDANAPGRDSVEMKRDDVAVATTAAAPTAPATPAAPATTPAPASAPAAATDENKGKS